MSFQQIVFPASFIGTTTERVDQLEECSIGSRWFDETLGYWFIKSGAGAWVAEAAYLGVTAPVSVKIDQTTPGTTNRVVPGAVAGAAAAYRTAVAAADVIAAVGTVTLSDINAVGVFANVQHNVKVVAGNTYGRTTPSTVQNITPTVNHQIKIAFAQVTGATFYDIYLSTDADPKWLARITEAQRAAGCQITAVGTVGAGGAAGSAYANLVGTGLQAATTAAVNNAYSIPATPVNCAGYQYVDFLLDFSRTGDAVAAALIVVPFFYDGTTYYFGELRAVSFGGVANVYDSMEQVLRVECRGYAGVGLVVASIAGTGASLTIRAVLS